ncbi:ABC transporter permease [Gorillibacterium timonense]|uniref:ABC transporter permease n=1 Tax=Gorillibacterium timonense TaxID=1689269 RepID=UPI00071D3E77|nr:ABC transporter permease [Gorillibacterium timonense]
MNSWKRAYLHTTRKKGKTILIFSILLIVSTLLLTCLAIRTATSVTALNIRKSLMGSFTINAKQLDMQLEDSVVTEILNIDGLTTHYNLRSYFRADYRSLDGQALEITTDGALDVPKGYEHAGKIISNTHSDADPYFTEAGFKLKKGRHITAEDRNVALIHEEFAQRNMLSLDDHLIFGATGETNRQAEVEIIGIFTNTVPQDAYGMIPSYDLYENIAFSDHATYSQLSYGDGIEHYQYGDFYVDDPAELDNVISNVKSITGLNGDECIYSKNDADYQNAKTALEALQRLVTTIVCVLIAVSVVLLILILSLWTRDRVHEAGVLLAMGINKGDILMQHILEILMVAALAFALSFGTSSLLAQRVGNHFLQQATAKEQVKLMNLTDEAANDKEVDKLFSLTSIKMNVSGSNLLLVYVIGTGIILLSVSLAAYPVMRMKPKEILTRMS